MARVQLELEDSEYGIVFDIKFSEPELKHDSRMSPAQELGVDILNLINGDEEDGD